MNTLGKEKLPEYNRETLLQYVCGLLCVFVQFQSPTQMCDIGKFDTL